MSGHGRHRLTRSNIWNRGIYWGSRTTQATAAAAVACAAVILMTVFPAVDQPLPAPTPTAAQQSLDAAVVAWKERVAVATLTTVAEAAQADSGRQAERKPVTKKKKSNDEG